MSQEEMKKRAAQGQMGQEAPGNMQRHPQRLETVRSRGMADPPSSFQLSFTPVTLPSIPRPTSVAIGDFNNDGNLDLVVLNYDGGTIVQFMGDGTGNFTLVSVAVIEGAFPFEVAVGDFNNDGNLDFAFTDSINDTVTVWLGTGEGDFYQPVPPIYVGSYPRGVAVGDFTNAGYQKDIVVVKYGVVYPGVAVLLGNGDGSFQSPQFYDIAGDTSVAVGDFTNAGYQKDIVVTYSINNIVSVLQGNGDGSFQNSWQPSVGSSPSGVAVGDFTNAGYQRDIVVANSGDNTISVVLGNGDGSFQPQQTYSVGTSPTFVAVGDFNNDGNLDLVVANSGDNTVSLLRGNGDGSFQPQQTYSVGASPTYVAVGDFNNDGLLDIIVANSLDNTVMVLLQSPLQSPLIVQVDTIQPTQNLLFSGPIATISEATSVSDISATIDWGDGTPPTAAYLNPNPDNSLTVSGSHTYTSQGTFPITVTATEGPHTSQGTGQAIVLAPLAVQVGAIYATANVPFIEYIATISGATSVSDTSATIAWGDGTPPTVAHLSANPDNSLTVSGSHTYTSQGTFPYTVTATEGLRMAQNTGQAQVQGGQILTLDDSVQGSGLNQFHYVGHGWRHCRGGCNGDSSGLHHGSYSWDNVLNEYVTITFTGTQIAFYGVKDPRHGIGAVSIDGGTETMIDFYAPTRAGDQLLWTSLLLWAGTHTLKLRVTHTRHPRSAGYFVTVDRVDIRR